MPTPKALAEPDHDRRKTRLLLTDAGATPRHLAIARELVQNIEPENNHYHLGGQAISMPGDLFSNKYAMTADCSGFLLAVFDRAGYTTRSKMAYLTPATCWPMTC